MSLWKQNKIKKQQRKKRNKKVLKAREEILSLLVADKVKKAGEIASALLVKYPGDIRVWRLVAGVKAWERFGERIKGIPPKRKEELKSSALKVMRRELTSRDNLRAEVLAETLISLVPAGEVITTEEKTSPVAEEVPAAAEAADKPVEEAPAKRPSASRRTGTKKKSATTAKKPSESGSKSATKKTSSPRKKTQEE